MKRHKWIKVPDEWLRKCSRCGLEQSSYTKLVGGHAVSGFWPPGGVCKAPPLRRGRPRNPPDAVCQIGLRLPAYQLALIDARAAELGQSRSDYVRDSLLFRVLRDSGVSAAPPPGAAQTHPQTH